MSFLFFWEGGGPSGRRFHPFVFFYCRLLCREVFQPQEQIPHRVQNRSCCDSSCFCGLLSAEGEETDFPWLGGNSSPADNSSSRISFLTSGLVSHAGVFRGAHFFVPPHKRRLWGGMKNEPPLKTPAWEATGGPAQCLLGAAKAWFFFGVLQPGQRDLRLAGIINTKNTKIQQLTERANRTIRHTRLQSETRFLNYVQYMLPLTCILNY